MSVVPFVIGSRLLSPVVRLVFWVRHGTFLKQNAAEEAGDGSATSVILLVSSSFTYIRRPTLNSKDAITLLDFSRCLPSSVTQQTD
jgi:hypothetical protein